MNIIDKKNEYILHTKTIKLIKWWAQDVWTPPPHEKLLK